MADKKTPCECPLAGYCTRHGMNKTSHYHRLCENHPGYFKMWEEGRGPGQTGKPQPKTEEIPTACSFCQNTGCTGECRNNNQLPPKKEMAQNLAKAAKDHAMSGFKTMSDEDVQARLDICGDCEHYIPQSSRCQLCGCFTKYKARLKSGGCPINKW